MTAFNGVKVFSAAIIPQRDTLGDAITRWMAANQHFTIMDTMVTQSSGDEAFHCLSITIFYFDPSVAARVGNA